MALLEAKEIGFSYGEKQILTDVSFTLDSAQVTAVIGPNGSGKTTLLKIINGTLFPASGEMLIAGRKTQNWPRRELAATAAIVPQETPAVFPFYAEEIVLMGRFPHLSGLRFEGDGDYRIVQEAMRQTDCLSFAARRFAELSAGERQRVLIARALAQEPQVLLLDESTAFLDLKHQVHFLNLLRQLNETQKLTVIFVTHDINLAAQYADQIIMLESGKIYAIGNSAEVITADNIKKVYEVEVLVDCNPQSGLPRMTIVK